MAYCCWRVIHGINSSNIYVCISACMYATHICIRTFISKVVSFQNCDLSRRRLRRLLQIVQDWKYKMMQMPKIFANFLYADKFSYILSLLFFFLVLLSMLHFCIYNCKIILIIISSFLSKLSFWHLHSFWISSMMIWIIWKEKL